MSYLQSRGMGETAANDQLQDVNSNTSWVWSRYVFSMNVTPSLQSKYVAQQMYETFLGKITNVCFAQKDNIMMGPTLWQH